MELACGTGRVAIPLARDGHYIVGVDNSESMLDQARRNAGSTEIVESFGDYDGAPLTAESPQLLFVCA